MNDEVLSARNLGAGEYWGRVIEREIAALRKSKQAVAQRTSADGRTNSSQVSSIARQAKKVEEQAIRLQQALQQLPGVGVGSDVSYGFSLNAGWNTVLVKSLTIPQGKTNIQVLGRGFTYILANASGGGGSAQFVWPFDPRPLGQGGTVSSEYGPRTGGASNFHEGIDFAVPEGTPIYAPGSGVLENRGFNSSMGNYIVMDHPGGIRTRYFHLVAFNTAIPIGGSVAQGDVIGYVGNTGGSFGAHLHWETILNGNHMNPRDFMAIYGTGSSTPTSVALIKARMRIESNSSIEFAPFKIAGETSLKQFVYPQHGLTFSSSAGTVSIALDVYATEATSDTSNIATLSVEGIFS